MSKHAVFAAALILLAASPALADGAAYQDALRAQESAPPSAFAAGAVRAFDEAYALGLDTEAASAIARMVETARAETAGHTARGVFGARPSGEPWEVRVRVADHVIDNGLECRALQLTAAVPVDGSGEATASAYSYDCQATAAARAVPVGAWGLKAARAAAAGAGVGLMPEDEAALETIEDLLITGRGKSFSHRNPRTGSTVTVEATDIPGGCFRLRTTFRLAPKSTPASGRAPLPVLAKQCSCPVPGL